jgi:hypothetical protein
MLETAASFVLGRVRPCDVAQGYVSVLTRPAVALTGVLNIL